MWLVIIGLALLAMHFAGIGPPGGWNFNFSGDLWKFALPFGLAVAWWWIADVSGLTQRRAMRKMDDRKTERRDKAIAALGLNGARPSATRADRGASQGKGSSAAVAPPARDPTQQ
jgi:small Trp-rich protein